MDALSHAALAYCALVLVAAFAVRGGAGFGGGAVAVPLLALALPLQTVVPLVTVLNMLSSIGHGVRAWRSIVWREIALLAPVTLLGVAAGLHLLSALDAEPLRRALGAFVICYAIYALATTGRAMGLPRRWLLPIGLVFGSGAGLVGTLFGGAAGPLYVVYLNAAGLARDAFRVTITTIMLFQGLTRIGGYAALGFYNAPLLVMLAMALPLMVLGSWLGAYVVRRVDQARFNRIIGAVMLVSGAALLLK
jgi:uncharacterized membrane protein YfcA